VGKADLNQARGYGSMLMKHALERCDGEEKLAYLESSNPRGLSLYLRHGFELIGTIQVAGFASGVPDAAQTQKPSLATPQSPRSSNSLSP
jgi:GNAT superfamily N-acetyltransferase